MYIVYACILCMLCLLNISSEVEKRISKVDNIRTRVALASILCFRNICSTLITKQVPIANGLHLLYSEISMDTLGWWLQSLSRHWYLLLLVPRQFRLEERLQVGFVVLCCEIWLCKFKNNISFQSPSCKIYKNYIDQICSIPVDLCVLIPWQKQHVA